MGAVSKLAELHREYKKFVFLQLLTRVVLILAYLTIKTRQILGKKFIIFYVISNNFNTLFIIDLGYHNNGCVNWYIVLAVPFASGVKWCS